MHQLHILKTSFSGVTPLIMLERVEFKHNKKEFVYLHPKEDIPVDGDSLRDTMMQVNEVFNEHNCFKANWGFYLLFASLILVSVLGSFYYERFELAIRFLVFFGACCMLAIGFNCRKAHGERIKKVESFVESLNKDDSKIGWSLEGLRNDAFNNIYSWTLVAMFATV